MDPLVSIIIPVYNGANYMRDAINSALAQTYSNIEVIVVNDGSNDDGATWKIAHSYGDKIRYFEKPNGGVSTALNVGIKNMRGKYFSWLSHDDMYYPNKIQAEIDALRKAGDMFRIVYSNFAIMNMLNNTVTEHKAFEEKWRSFWETGALVPLFWLVSGCSLLIPKIYFDIYGGFDENYRAVQDYKKWFEMFRGRRLLYVDKTLIISRTHPQQTGNTYSKVPEEGRWLFDWMIKNVETDDLVGSGLTDMYHFYSAFLTLHMNHRRFVDVIKYAFQKLLELPESPDIMERTQKFIDFMAQRDYANYFLKEHEILIKREWSLRGITIRDESLFIPANQVPMLKSDKPIRVFDYNSLQMWFINTPMKKSALSGIRFWE